MEHEADLDQEHIPGFSDHDETVANYLTDNFDHRKTVALCNESLTELFYIGEPHSRLLDITKAAQIDSELPTFSIDVTVEEFMQQDNTALFQFAAKGFAGDMPFTIALNQSSTFTFRYDPNNRDYQLAHAPADQYDLTHSIDDLSIQELLTFFYALIHEKAAGAGDDKRHLEQMQSFLADADIASLQPIITEIGASRGTLVEQHSKSMFYPDTVDRTIGAELTTIEYPDVSQRLLQTTLTRSVPLKELASTTQTQKTVSSLNLDPVTDALGPSTPNVEIHLSVDGATPSDLPPAAIQAMSESLDYLMTNAIIVDQLSGDE